MEVSFTEGEFYQEHFDSRAYIDNFYSRPEGHSGEKRLLTFVLDCLSKTFSAGRYKGQTLIDVGSGPTIHSVLSACEHFQEIVLSDFADANRQELEKWLRNEEACFNWKPVIQYVCNKEKKSPSEVEAKVRQRVKQVLKCDVRLENPFHPQTLKPADCMITCLCLEAACKDMLAYKKALANLSTLLRPAGVLVMVGVLEESFYCVNQTRFSCLQLSQESIEAELHNLGFTIQELNIFPSPEPENNVISDHKAVFHLVALKSDKI
ncbi:indolethylamine N-methyltransferase-like [Colossoma macropomum]|uniref:indolethylamine N-methyltransferase-like n=1 Tax=Colossoma macropomum TaxID=42526 RepID=UPI0018641777|nr:indolethylamine N-methyltransferase-like [Colossoma macropomum]